MQHHRFSQRSLNNLKGTHIILQIMAHEALKISQFDFIVTCGLRNKKQQRFLLNTGKTTTMNSRHLTGHAIDFAPIKKNGKIDWHDMRPFRAVANAFKTVAKQMGLEIDWGGEWKSIVDGPHIQLSRQDFPKSTPLPDFSDVWDAWESNIFGPDFDFTNTLRLIEGQSPQITPPALAPAPAPASSTATSEDHHRAMDKQARRRHAMR